MIVIESEELQHILKTYDGKAVDPKLEIGNSVLNIICQKLCLTIAVGEMIQNSKMLLIFKP